MKSRSLPVFWFAGFLLLVLLPGLVLENWQSFIQGSVPHVAPQHWGNDYRFFFGASRSIWNSDSPYADWFFTSPPFAAFLNLPLIGLLFEQAFPIFTLVTAGASLLALWLLTQKLTLSNPIWCFGLLVAALLCGLPFQFLISRGNTDGIVLILVVVAIFLLPRLGVSSGMLLGMAISLKLYPIILLLPLLVFRKRRVIFSCLATILVLAFITWPHWSAFGSRLAQRSQEFRIDENLSLLAAVYPFLSARMSFDGIKLVAGAIFVSLLALQLWADWRKSPPGETGELTARLALYFPLMISVPGLVFNYEAIFIVATVPAIVWLRWRNLNSAPEVFILMLTGAALTQFQSVWLCQLSGWGFAHAVPALGLLILVAAVSIRQFASLFSAGDRPIESELAVADASL